MDQAAAATQLNVRAKTSERSSRYGSTSSVLHEVTCFHGDFITIKDLSTQLGDRGFGMLLFLFALPNTIPLPLPGISTITGLPLIFIAAQLMLGKSSVWLPNWLANKQIPMGTLRLSLQKLLPWVVKLEKFVKPRLDVITTRNFERFAGGIIFVLAVLLALPVPLGNLPLGIAMAVLALGLTERDGFVMITGWLLTVLALCFFVMLVRGYLWIFWQLISGFF